ncbi:hypothetical protein [Motiliproteus sp. MSK22-1]|uniref:hypothetical protein n=1 Tax=Motiliproteus sp. MSK22-1 TaxID=1897630 RepID=UPI0009785995|nr:hypothetical protein [Motiliproteus sp. MSK22-1]OMH28041.1 hypothetical protein BGP75_21980 [Motiliproteus sp. MSK22-1]
MYLNIVEPVLLILGFLVFVSSIIIYLKRTRNFKSVLMFWQADMAMIHKEFILHRIGIVIMFMGIVLRFVNNW